MSKISGVFTAANTDAPTGRILHLLRSNDSPSQLETLQLKDTLDTTLASMPDLEDRISTMQNELQALLGERSRKQGQIRDCRSLLHPIRRIPKEILCEIFKSLLEQWDDISCDKAGSLAPTSPHFVVSCVSNYWRTIALSFPEMWSKVRITQADFACSGSRASLMLATQLVRSSNHELSVSLRFEHRIKPPHPLLPHLFCTSSRWKTLDLFSPSELNGAMDSVASFSGLRGSLTSLHTLNLVGHYTTDPPIIGKPTFTMFEFAPNLRTLCGNPRWILHFNLPFSNITTFISTGIAACTAYGYLLSLMPNVRKIKIRCDVPGSSHDNPYPEVPAVISLPHLGIATLEDDGAMIYSNHEFCRVLDRLSVPALQELDLLISTRFTQKLRGLLTRSRCRLIKLSVRNMGCLPCGNSWEYDLEHLEILRDIPSLVSLTLNNPSENFGDAVLKKLIQDQTFMPALQTLELRNRGGNSDDRFWVGDSTIDELKISRPSLIVQF
ncbi:hypothetical protein C8J56DRAFT_932803 [Mycena floridula]|nr:hypothetical protein C8J56DRAFT_932803 [Mycena floridula]